MYTRGESKGAFSAFGLYPPRVSNVSLELPRFVMIHAALFCKRCKLFLHKLSVEVTIGEIRQLKTSFHAFSVRNDSGKQA